MRLLRTLFISLALLAGAVACGGDGEDRPGQVTSEGETGSVSGTGSASASGTGSASASGHGHGGEEADFTDAEADTVVDVTFDDFAFTGLPQSVKGPKVFFRATNQGEEEHELVIVKDDEELYELEAIAPGEEGTLAVELEPGTYRIICLVEKDGKAHEELGMVAQLTVE